MDDMTHGEAPQIALAAYRLALKALISTHHDLDEARLALRSYSPMWVPGYLQESEGHEARVYAESFAERIEALANLLLDQSPAEPIAPPAT